MRLNLKQDFAMKIKEQAASYMVQRKKYTYQDYLNLPDDGKRYEVINGELIMTPAPNIFHQTVLINFVNELKNFLNKEKLGKMLCAPTDVKLSDGNVVQPDIIFISQDNSNIVTENNVDGAPDLIIETLSPGAAYYDLIEKKEIYERFEVKEYWIVDPKKRRVEIYNNVDQHFELYQRIEGAGVVKSLVIKGFEITLENIFSME